MTFARAAAGRNIKIAAERGNKIVWRKDLERVLDGATVIYGSAAELQATLDYGFFLEKKFSYKGFSMDEIIHHLAVFVSGLWQIHVFGEGNTRATAVFFIKYLRTLGFDVTNDIFAEHAWYFRNSLVRANYNDLKNGIHETTEYLEVFLRNLLLNENHPLLITGHCISNGKFTLLWNSGIMIGEFKWSNPECFYGLDCGFMEQVRILRR